MVGDHLLKFSTLLRTSEMLMKPIGLSFVSTRDTLAL